MIINNISTHSLKDITDKKISINMIIGKADNDELYGKSAHRRDDHYLFIFQKNGRSKIIVDFKEIELIGNVIMCILPGQIHLASAIDNKTEAWLITIDTSIINDEYRTIFEDNYFFYEPITLETSETTLLNQCIQLILSTQENTKSNLIPNVAYSLIDACIGIFASAYNQIENNTPSLARKLIITKEFKRLLLQNIKTHKSSAAFAKILNITPAYLNEAIKSTTGFTVSFWIRQTIITEAKRYLYATNITVKEIAYLLGFEDHAYFNRYFSKIEGKAPLQFRTSYRK
ncbi:helix-turn-helix transcriptional regulator [Chryseobacterium ginsenosidimutans]|uniref:helix-turn-helix domain-containing protein n=1 Tax=Chryseobacterium ginsenosidimutans TaxID=687846 RepID=UPI0031D7C3D1